MTLHIDFPGNATNYVSTPSAGQPSGNIEIEIEAATLWQTSLNYVPLIGVFAASPNRSWLIATRGDGRITMVWSSDGSTDEATASPSQGITKADGEWVTLNVTRNVTTGAVVISADGSPIYSGTRAAGASYASASYLGICRVEVSSAFNATKVRSAKVLDGIGGSVWAKMDPADATTVGDTDTWVGSVGGLTWTAHGTGLTIGPVGGRARNLTGPGQVLQTGG